MVALAAVMAAVSLALRIDIWRTSGDYDRIDFGADIMLPLSLLLTVLSWRYVEQPFLRRRSRSSYGGGERVDGSASAQAPVGPMTDVAPRATVSA